MNEIPVTRTSGPMVEDELRVELPGCGPQFEFNPPFEKLLKRIKVNGWSLGGSFNYLPLN